jgi:hypothetical protein
MTVLAGPQTKTRFARAIGGAAAPVAAAPIPLNTPSMKKENNGKDVNVTLVPVGTNGVWGSNASAPVPEVKPLEEIIQQQKVAAAPVISSKPAPWAKSIAPNDSTPAAAESSKPAIAKTRRNWAEAEEEEEEDNDPRDAKAPVTQAAARELRPSTSTASNDARASVGGAGFRSNFSQSLSGHLLEDRQVCDFFYFSVFNVALS